MWKQQQPVAVVTAINGRKQFFVTLTGVPNHAGSTQMADRSDALVGAAKSSWFWSNSASNSPNNWLIP